jgi:hypothetical protein
LSIEPSLSNVTARRDAIPQDVAALYSTHEEERPSRQIGGLSLMFLRVLSVSGHNRVGPATGAAMLL